MGIHNLNPEFINHYNISDFFQQEQRGGQKTVYFVIIDGKKVVLKHFQNGQDDRFEREMAIYEKFKNSNGIPKIIKHGLYKNDIVVFEEFIEGHTLSDVVSNYKSNAVLVTQLMKDIFIILTPIWEADFVHRDIKPANIIIRKDGTPVILDFGIARDLAAPSITGTGWQPKTWTFASPEQYAGLKDMISYRTDFFSLAVLSYYLFYQKLPFGNTEAEIWTTFKSNNENFPYDDGFSLFNFCVKALKFSPAERPRKIQDLTKLL